MTNIRQYLLLQKLVLYVQKLAYWTNLTCSNKQLSNDVVLFSLKETCQAYVLQNRFLNSEILEFNKLRAHDSEILKAQAM